MLREFIEWCKLNYPVTVSDNSVSIFIDFYIKTDRNFSEIIPQKFWGIRMSFIYPEKIILEGGKLYIPGVSEYKFPIEHFMIRIDKYENNAESLILEQFKDYR